MSSMTITLACILAFLALIYAGILRRFLLPVWFLLGAYAVSGRPFWLIAAGLLGVAVVVKNRLDAKRRRDAFLAFAPPDATEAQREELRKLVPEYEKIGAHWRTARLFNPVPWETERLTIVNYLCLPPPPGWQADFRNGLSPHEQMMLMLAEGDSRKRLSERVAQAFLQTLQNQESQRVAESKRMREEEGQRHAPIVLDPLPVVEDGLELGFVMDRETRFLCEHEEEPVCLPPGEYVGRLRLLHTPPADGADWPASEMRCFFEFTCAAGRFACESKFNEMGLADLESPEIREASISLDDAPEAWRQALANRCLASGVQVIDDSRSRFEFKLGGTVYIIMTQYCHYRIDLALMADRRNLLMRIHGLLAEQWADDADAPEGSKFTDYEPVPPFCVTRPVAGMLPFAGPPLHLVPDADDWDDDRPLVFRRA